MGQGSAGRIGRKVPIDFELTDKTTTVRSQSNLHIALSSSDVSGDTRVVFGGEPLDVTVRCKTPFAGRKKVTRPLATLCLLNGKR